MRVDTALALRVLAHELRAPAGVAQGYLRMVLDGQLPGPADDRRALEQAREVLGRIGQLSQQASEAATWLERMDAATPCRVDARALTDDALDIVARSHAIDRASDLPAGTASLGTLDRDALAAAIATVVSATARERPGRPTAIRVRATGTPPRLELLAGSAEDVSALAAGPDAPDSTPIAIERGGLGLSLVAAAFVLDAHRAALWTKNGERGACAIRIPLET